jgi:hypothetical protein
MPAIADRFADLLRRVSELPDLDNLADEDAAAAAGIDLDALADLESELQAAFAELRGRVDGQDGVDTLGTAAVVASGLRQLRTLGTRLAERHRTAIDAEATAQGNRGPSLASIVARSPNPARHRSRSLSDAAEALVAAAERTSRQGDGYYPVHRFEDTWPEARRLTGGPDDQARIAAVVGPAALVAAGGICAPPAVRYDVPTVSGVQRPIRDALARFEASRGRVSFMPAPVLGDILTNQTNAAVTSWDLTTDTTPGGAIKTVQTIACQASETAEVVAQVVRLRFGNWNARFYPEIIDAWVNLALAAQARVSEQALWDALWAGGLVVSHAETLGAARDVLTLLDRAGSILRARHRVDPADVQLVAVAPGWLRDMIRADLAAGFGDLDHLTVADQEIAAFARARRVVFAWSDDVQIPGAPTTNTVLAGWPTTAHVSLFLSGTWAHLDGGTLDLGIVRDSTLNATNDAEIFSENFEGIARFGSIESLSIVASVCANGASAGTVPPEACVS